MYPFLAQSGCFAAMAEEQLFSTWERKGLALGVQPLSRVFCPVAPHSFPLALADPSSAPKPTVRASGTSARVGENFNVTCTVLGEPEVAVDFTWEYPGRKVGQLAMALYLGSPSLLQPGSRGPLLQVYAPPREPKPVVKGLP